MEGLLIAEALDKIGFNVDVIDFRSNANVDVGSYDLIIGAGGIFEVYFKSGSLGKAKTIFYAAGASVHARNIITLQRVRDVYLKRGVWIGGSSRYLSGSEGYATVLVDAIIALGTGSTADSYRREYLTPVYSVPGIYNKVQDPRRVLSERGSSAKNGYLWFGSAGLIHKGLDLVLDYFSVNQDLELHVCGDLSAEPDFVKAYGKELYGCSNIHVHGFIDIRTDEFKDILRSCCFVIFPSCSEGVSVATLTAIGNGALIPIVTKECSISTGYEICINGFTSSAIEESITQSRLLGFEEVRRLQLLNLESVEEQCGVEAFRDNILRIISDVVGVQDACEG